MKKLERTLKYICACSLVLLLLLFCGCGQGEFAPLAYQEGMTAYAVWLPSPPQHKTLTEETEVRALLSYINESIQEDLGEEPAQEEQAGRNDTITIRFQGDNQEQSNLSYHLSEREQVIIDNHLYRVPSDFLAGLCDVLGIPQVEELISEELAQAGTTEA